MASNQNPTDLARETLKLLAARRIAPTPANYHRIYQQISGASSDALQAGGERIVHILEEIAATHPGNAALSNLASAAAAGDSNQLSAILTGLTNGARRDWAPV